jgi:hypothetical protein
LKFWLLIISLILCLSSCKMQYRQQARVWKPFTSVQNPWSEAKEEPNLISSREVGDSIEFPYCPISQDDHLPVKRSVEKGHINKRESQDRQKSIRLDIPTVEYSDTAKSRTIREKHRKNKNEKSGAVGLFLLAIALNILFIFLPGDVAILPFILLMIPVLIVLVLILKNVFQDLKKSRPTPRPIRRNNFQDVSNKLKRATGILMISSGFLVIIGLMLEFSNVWIGYGVLIIGVSLLYISIVLLGIWLLSLLAQWL